MTEIPSASFIEKFKATTGAFSVAEAIALYNICLQAPDGNYIELGTHKGKSTLVALAALKPNIFTLVEPEFDKSIPIKEVAETISSFRKGFTICYSPTYSTDVLQPIDGVDKVKYAYVMLDSGDHGEELVQAEKTLLEDRIISGGILAMHDLNNQFTAVRRMYDQLLQTGLYEEVKVDWPAILKYVTENNLEEGNQSWHLYPDLGHPPNFVGAVRRK